MTAICRRGLKIPCRDWTATAAVWAGVLFLMAAPGVAQGPQGAAANSPQRAPGAPSPILRMPDGKPDLSGIWEGPFVQDMSKNVRNQQGAGPLPYTEWARARMADQVDLSVHCMPTGYTRTTNAPFPIEIVQRPDRVVFLYEMNNNFHIIFTDGRGHPKDLEPTWAGHSIGKWEGDTLVVDTVGFNGRSQLDTEGNPHSDALHVVEHFTRTDATHLAYDVTIEDPKAYTRPWKNVRTFTIMKNWELLEYSCNENNKDVTEGHIK
jgi:hypothetical protein